MMSWAHQSTRAARAAPMKKDCVSAALPLAGHAVESSPSSSTVRPARGVRKAPDLLRMTIDGDGSDNSNKDPF